MSLPIRRCGFIKKLIYFIRVIGFEPILHSPKLCVLPLYDTLINIPGKGFEPLIFYLGDKRFTFKLTRCLNEAGRTRTSNAEAWIYNPP